MWTASWGIDHHAFLWGVLQISQQPMIDCQTLYFDMRHHMYLHGLLKNLPMRVLKISSPNFNTICVIWVPNMWCQLLLLSFKCASRFLYLPIFTFYLMAQSNHVNKNQSQGIHICRLSSFGPCLGKVPFGLISFCCSQRSQFLDLDKLTSRLENMKNSCSLFKILCRPTPDLESITTTST